MAKTNWGNGEVVKAQDMNDIGEEINSLRTDLDNIHIPDASLSEKGIVQLTDAIDSTSETLVPTAKALATAVAEVKSYAEEQIADIPDASLTKKGITKLSSATNSPSESEAATPKAVKAAYDLANGKQNPTRLSNDFATPSNDIIDYPDGISVFWVTGSNGQAWCNAAFGDTGQGYGWVTTYKAGSSGYQAFTEMYTGTSQSATTGARQAKRIKRDSNTFWQPFIRDIDSTGGTINGPVTVSENDFRVTGVERAVVLVNTNAPRAIRLQPGGDGGFYVQDADKTTGQQTRGNIFWIAPDNNAFFPKNIFWAGGDLDSLKQLSNDQKTKWAGVVVGKGGSASSSMTSDQLVTATNNLTFRHSTLRDSLQVDTMGTSNPNGETTTKNVFTVPANSLRCFLYGSGSMRCENTNPIIEQWIDFVDQSGVVASCAYHSFQNGSQDPGESLGPIRFDKTTGQITWTQNGSARSASIPGNFNTNAPYTIRFRMYYAYKAGGDGIASSIYYEGEVVSM